MSPHARAAGALLAALLSMGLSLGPVALLPAPAGAVSAEAKTYAKSAFRTTNTVRDNRDRVRLRHSPCLQKYADRQARKLASTGKLVHQDLGPILKNCHLNLAGENLALGFSSGAKAVKQGWMKSKSHRANILERRYRRMALAARQTDDGDWVAVQLFGRRA